MAETPHHGYNVPEKGAENWHEPLNENFELIDSDIEVRGPQSELDEWSDKLYEQEEDQQAGAKYFSTDTGRIYVGTGSGWRLVPSTGPSPNLDYISSGGLGGSPMVYLNGDKDFLGIHRENPLTGSESFGVRTAKSGYGGMYIDSTDASGDGKPFYGYAIDGDNKAWHFFDPTAGINDGPAWSVRHEDVGNSTIRVYRDSLHVKASDTHRALILESGDGSDGWAVGTGMDSGNFNFYNSGDVSGSWDIKARIHDDTGEYEVASDARLKRDIVPLDGVLEDVCSLNPSSYRFKATDDDSPRAYGFLAQEVREVFPELVRGEEDDEFLGLAYDGFAALAVQAIREQQDRIESRDAEIEALTDRIDELGVENEALREDLSEKDDRIDELEQRLAAVETRFDDFAADSKPQAAAD